MGLIREPRKTWRRLGTPREAGEGFGRPGVTWEGISRVGRALAALKTPKKKKTKKQKQQRFQNLLGLLLGRPLRASVFCVFFGSQGLGSGPRCIFQIPNMMGLIREPRKTWRRPGTPREAGEGFGRPGVTWIFVLMPSAIGHL